MMTKFKVGDKIRYLGGVGYDEEDLTIGGIYEISEVESDDIPYFLDDAGDEWYVMKENEVFFELVTEPSEETPVEASPTVIELLANISRRLHEAERQLKSQAYEINELYKANAEGTVADRG